MNNKRGNWGSKFGFLAAAVGSAVGLGNIWGFPYKMGKTGGGVFLIIYLALVVLVGFSVMLGEIVIGRKTKFGPVLAYNSLSKKFKIFGYMGVVSGFLILAFYSVLGGIVLKYMFDFFIALFNNSAILNSYSGADHFTNFITGGWGMIICTAIFMAVTALIVTGGVSKGIEKFTKIAMPALFVLLAVIIVFVLFQPGASEGLKFMFKPDFSVFKPGSEISFFDVFKTAAGQMFFSLSLGMGCMMTYGSYLTKETNIESCSIIIPIADTIVALLAGLIVMPAVFAFGLEPTAGPGLLFISLFEVFVTGMGGFVGALIGFVFYLLVFIAAVTSSISLLEVCTSYAIDRRIVKNKEPKRGRITLIITLISFVVALPVALDGLGSSGAIINFKPFGYCWLDFYDLISEGVLMPLGALVMSLIIGWRYKSLIIKEEVEVDGTYKLKGFPFWNICFKFIVPIVMIVVLIAQLQSFGIF